MIGLSWLRLLSFSPIESLKAQWIGTGLGLGTLSLLGFLMTFFHLLYPWLSFLLLMASALSLGFIHREIIRNVRQQILKKMVRPSPLSIILFTLAGTALFFHILGAFLPPTSFDEVNYQLSFPKLYILNNGFIPTRFNHQSFLPMNMSMLYILGLLSGGVVTAKLFSWGMGLLTCGALFLMGKKLMSAKASFFGIIFFLLTPVIGVQFKYAAADLGTGFYEVMAIWLLLDWFKNKTLKTHLLLSSIFWGLCLGCKYTGILGYGLATLFVIGFSIRERSRFRQFWIWSLVPLTICSLWWIRNLIQTGNPVNPLFSNFIRSRNFVFAGTYRPMVEYSSGLGFPTYFPLHSLWDFLKLPWTLTTKYNDFNHYLGALYFLVFVFLIFNMKSILKTNRWLLATVLCYWLIWVVTKIHITRYFVAGLGLTCLIMGGIVVEIMNKFPKPFSFLVFIPLLLAAVQNVGAVIYIQNFYKKPWGYLTGRCSEFHYVDSQLTPRSPLAAYSFINENLPQDSKILVVGEFRTFYLNRSFLASTPWDHDYWHEMIHLSDTEADLRGFLHKEGITHVLLNDNSILEKTGASVLTPWTEEDIKKSQSWKVTALRKIFAQDGVWIAEVPHF